MISLAVWQVLYSNLGILLFDLIILIKQLKVFVASGIGIAFLFLFSLQQNETKKFRRDTWIVATWANKKKSPHRASQTTYHAFLKKLILLKAIAVNLLIQPNEYEVRKIFFFSVRFYQFSERRLKDLRIILAHKKQTSGNSEIR